MRGSHILGRLAMVAIPATGIAARSGRRFGVGPVHRRSDPRHHARVDGAAQRRRQPVRHGGRDAELGPSGRRRRAREQLQRLVERAGHRDDDRADDPGRRPIGVRAHHRSTTCRASAPAASGSPPRSRSCSNRWVIVGSLPTSDGTSATAKAGCLIILDSNGNVVETLNNAYGINGPWDLTAVDRGR